MTQTPTPFLLACFICLTPTSPPPHRPANTSFLTAHSILKLCFKTPMESHGKASSHGRPLFELLEVQQEPFLLEVYLLENGYSINLLKSQDTFKCWPTETCRKLFGFSSHGIKCRRGVSFISSVLHSLVHLKRMMKTLHLEITVPAKINRCVLSRSRFSRLLHSCEEIMDAKVLWKNREDNTQLSPVSVFEFHSAEVLSPHHHSKEEEIGSTSTMNSDMSEEAHYFTFFSNLNQIENGARKKKQPLLQCRKELKQRICASHDGLSLSKTEKSSEMQIFSLEKHRKEVARIAKLIDMDLSGTRSEWSHFNNEAKKTGLEIERLIFEEIREETVVEMFGSRFLHKIASF